MAAGQKITKARVHEDGGGRWRVTLVGSSGDVLFASDQLHSRTDALELAESAGVPVDEQPHQPA